MKKLIEIWKREDWPWTFVLPFWAVLAVAGFGIGVGLAALA
jgi:hypothetical protein